VGPRHLELLGRYVDDLRAAQADVDRWWGDLSARLLRELGRPEAVVEELQRRWPAGPGVHPRMLAVVRKYFLECDRLNKVIEAEEPDDDPEAAEAHELAGEEESPPEEVEDFEIPPRIFVGVGLLSEETNDLALYLSKMTVLPVGHAENGDYV
jgi:hypothetical protein